MASARPLRWRRKTHWGRHRKYNRLLRLALWARLAAGSGTISARLPAARVVNRPCPLMAVFLSLAADLRQMLCWRVVSRHYQGCKSPWARGLAVRPQKFKLQPLTIMAITLSLPWNREPTALLLILWW